MTSLRLRPVFAVLALAAITAVSAAPASVASRAACGSPTCIPTRPTVYNVVIRGTSYSYFTLEGKYKPYQTFTRRGVLLVRGGVRAANGNNGRNVRDIALISGFPGLSRQAGSILFASNMALFNQIGLPTRYRQNAPVDVTRVYASRRGVLTVDPDGDFYGQPTARIAQLNLFEWASARANPIATPKQILTGRIQLRFGGFGRRATGTIRLGGKSLIEQNPNGQPYLYVATITASAR